MKMLIFGFTGAGKTSFLNSLRQSHKNAQLIDLDDHIFCAYKEAYKSLSDLIEAKGETWFRASEKESLLDLLAGNNDIIVALGGGTLDRELLNKLKELNIKGYFVDEDFETCWNRIKNDTNRIIVKKGKEYCAKLYRERRELFLSAKEILK